MNTEWTALLTTFQHMGGGRWEMVVWVKGELCVPKQLNNSNILGKPEKRPAQPTTHKPNNFGASQSRGVCRRNEFVCHSANKSHTQHSKGVCVCVAKKGGGWRVAVKGLTKWGRGYQEVLTLPNSMRCCPKRRDDHHIFPQCGSIENGLHNKWSRKIK